MNDWIKIKNYYITHDISLKDLAKKFNVSESAVNTHCRKENWSSEKSKKKQEIDRKVTEKLTENEIARKVAKNEQHIELYDDIIEISKGILKLYKEKLELSNVNKVKVSPDALEKVVSCIEKSQKGQRLALNMEKEDILDTEPKFVYIENLDDNKI